MEIVQSLVDKLPLILMSLGFVLWALSRVIEAKAKSDPTMDKWDMWSEKLTWASRLYSQAIDWLSDTNNLQLGPGQTKLSELNRLVKIFEEKVAAGRYLEAINDVVGFWTSAKSKLPSILADVKIPPASIPPTGAAKEADSKPR